MSENKPNTKTTESGELNASEKLEVKPKSGRRQKSDKAKRTKKVVVKMPTIYRRLDNEHKLFPGGIEGMKGGLEEIKEESKDKLTDEIILNGENENKENVEIQKTENDAEDDAKQTQDKSGENKTESEQLYGMFTRTNTERSFLSNRSNSCSINLPTKRKPSSGNIKRPKSTTGWTKKEIDLFLPRKSFFSVHDNTLSAAGYHIRSDEDRKIPEWRNLLRMHTYDELHPPEEETGEKPPLTLGFDDESDDDEQFGLENVETAMSAVNKDSGTGTKGKRRHKDKKGMNNEREEYKPLYDYLKYIHDNPDEYIHANKYVGKNIDHRHPNNMVRLGRAYRRGHHGTHRNSIYIHAITDLKQKMSETTGLKPSKLDKSSVKKESTDVAEPTTTITPDETEIEKLKSKAEKWAKGLTTQQWLKAKELALKDVGDEDVSMSKWWLVFRSCHYLRLPSHMTDLSH